MIYLERWKVRATEIEDRRTGEDGRTLTGKVLIAI